MAASFAIDPKLIAADYRDACRYDVLAAKPGNVAIGLDAHRMSARDFLVSARVTAPLFAQPKLAVGELVRESVRETIKAVGCNTNLGILLLCAPLAVAARMRHSSTSMSVRLGTVLDSLTADDARETYAGIRMANPGGIGATDEADIHTEPSIGLVAAMQLAANRDRIAGAYANRFAEVLDDGIVRLSQCLSRNWCLRDSVVACYLGFLAAGPDSHIARKHGKPLAKAVSAQAQDLESAFKACENPASFASQLQEFDSELKKGGVNPGTSADLTVASVFALSLSARLVVADYS